MSEINRAGLKTFFETGDTPSEAQFGDLIDSSVNITENGYFDGVTSAVAGVVPSNQGTAVGISKRFSKVITGGAGASGVILPTVRQGGMLVISNASGYPVDIYPKAGETIEPYAVNIPLQIQDKEVVILIGSGGSFWKVIRSVPGNGPIMSYKALVSQAGVAAPTVTVLQNNLTTTPAFTYVGVGNYTITAAGLFTAGKVFARVQGSLTGGFWASVNTLVSPNTLQLQTFNNVGAGIDAKLSNTPLEILIYP